ncbi:MAG: hypothetical protein RLZZ502_636 [Pseudomonadota bacterium]
MNTIFDLKQGNTPVLLSLPHVGTHIPEPLRGQYVTRALAVEDTDWHLSELYAFAQDLGVSIITPRVSRYVIDLNRPPDNTPMYPGAANTELCPTRFFTGDALYQAEASPDPEAVSARRNTYWQPYHTALTQELARIKAQHGFALLWDGHSIRSRLSWLFEGQLPDLNLGTANGASCDPTLRAELSAVLQRQQDYTHAVDGRFKGGYITRHYGQPAVQVHAVQLEMCQRTYMHEHAPYAYDARKAIEVQAVLQELFAVLLQWRPTI